MYTLAQRRKQMVQIKSLCNKWMTIEDLLNYFGTPANWKYKKTAILSLLQF